MGITIAIVLVTLGVAFRSVLIPLRTIFTGGLTLIYVFAMWNSGIVQGLMWRTYTEGNTLAYSFVDTLVAMYPYYIARTIGGLLFLIGAILGAQPAQFGGARTHQLVVVILAAVDGPPFPGAGVPVDVFGDFPPLLIGLGFAELPAELAGLRACNQGRTPGFITPAGVRSSIVSWTDAQGAPTMPAHG